MDRCWWCRIPGGLHRLSCPFRIVCPRCHAHPEDRCRRPTGQGQELPHVERTVAARYDATAAWAAGQEPAA